MEKPLVSILMNCYNGQRYLKETLDSVIAQKYKNWELIFWDNHSSDNSSSIIKEYNESRFKYFYSDKHTGLGEARLKAFKHLTGEFIAVLDTDDIWFPDKLEKQVIAFKEKDVGIVISNTYFFNEKKRKKLYKSNPLQGWVTDCLIVKYYVSLETVIMRKSLINGLNENFDKNYDLIADFDLIVRLSSVGKLVYIPEILSGWRVHYNNDSFKQPIKFIEEKESWIKKVKNNKNFSKKFRQPLDELQLNLYRHKMIINLIDRKRKESYLNFLKYKTKKPFDILFIVFSFIPFTLAILKNIYLRKLKNGL